CLLAFPPAFLVLRGLAYDPAIFSLDLSHRLGLPLLHTVTAGYLLAMSISLCLVCTAAKPNLWRSLGLFSCAVQIAGLMLTFSRGAWLGCGAGMVYFVVAAKKWKTLAALATIAAAGVLIFPPIQHRLATLVRPQDDATLTDRLQLLGVALQVGLEHPVVGAGYGRQRFKESIQPHLRGTNLEGSPYWHAHNLYLEIFARTGFLGLLSFLWLMGRTFVLVERGARRRSGPERWTG